MELLQNVAATLRFPEPNGDPVDFADPPKVTVTRDSDGSKVLDAVDADKVEGKEGEDDFWTVGLAASDLAEVDLLTAVWSGDLAGGGSGAFDTYAEVVGGFAVSLPEVQKKLGNETKADAELFRAREIASREIEEACGVAFRPRYARERLTGGGRRRLMLEHRGVLRILAVTIDGTALSPEEVADLDLDGKGILTRSVAWPDSGVYNIEVSYVHALTNFLAAREPICDYAAYLLIPAATDFAGRATSISNENGTFSLVTPGVRGANFPLPSVNAFVKRFEKLLVG